jgi:hypothetical protein
MLTQSQKFENDFNFLIDYYYDFDPYESKFKMFRDMIKIMNKNKILRWSSLFLDEYDVMYDGRTENIQFKSNRSIGYKLFINFLQENGIEHQTQHLKFKNLIGQVFDNGVYTNVYQPINDYRISFSHNYIDFL